MVTGRGTPSAALAEGFVGGRRGGGVYISKDSPSDPKLRLRRQRGGTTWQPIGEILLECVEGKRGPNFYKRKIEKTKKMMKYISVVGKYFR